jgi:peptide/nickel transport system permease protein
VSIDRLGEARQAMQKGDRFQARKLLSQVLLSDKRNEQAWLMMARLGDTEQQVVECLEWALKINPYNESTRTALVALKRKSAAQASLTTAQAKEESFQPARPEDRPPQTQVVREEPFEKQIQLEKPNGKGIQAPHRKANWSLLIGSIIVLFVVLIAIIGTRVAPQDPMEEHAILQIGNKWFIPPFNAFQVQGYILGSDEFGRDLLSRILFAVRPTLIMVIIVAMVRLFIGTLIGLGAGWSNGRIGRILDGLISAALSVPIFIVALAAIAMLGAEIGLLAFIVGLSINGWGETARFVREQTRLTKGQLYIESAHALGASNIQMLSRHVLRQIMPMVWMLFAFEISGTLMVTAGLGFLGYFIGGDIWIEVADFVSRRTSGSPELGQMLATSLVNLLQPWPLVLTGSVIFITVLGFNLLGDGLRQRLNPEYINRNSPLALFSYRFSFWFEQSVSYPVSGWLKANRLRPALVITAVVALMGSIYLYQTMVASRFNPSRATLTVPGGQISASERIDPYGTLFMNYTGPTDPAELWIINHPAGFSGTPVISTDGTIYVAGLDSILIALNPDGTPRWKTSLPESPLGPLALGPQGMIYVTNSKGGISSFSQDGNLLWTYTTELNGKPNHGPIVASNGTIYYLLEDFRGDSLFALLPNGQLLWSSQPGTRSVDSDLRLSPDEQQIFIKNIVVNTTDGSLVDITLPTHEDPLLSNKAQLFVGADGKTYLLAGHIVMQWTQTSQGFSLVQSADWNYRAAGISQTTGYPVDAGATPKGDIWIFYSGYYGGTTVYWLDPTGKILGNFSPPYNEKTRLIAIDGTDIAYICGFGYDYNQAPLTTCEAYHQNGTEPIWTYAFPEGTYGVLGGAMAHGRLYIITPDGSITALGESSSYAPVPTSTP